ncbi:WAP four-disulfide core domain protein 18-like [Crassostrea angulata]|uniref:WAP four-disulfide core domain protein 18-like n=1 Tax=Magallana angulata TaxID=2784310 RepID=UPI0022B1A0C9|nr:WAP four-disulfide core domain protein 18-like [Crassostrea angulata]
MIWIIVGFLSINAVVGQFNWQKPGQCPVSDIVTTCDCPTNQMACYTDFHCPSVLKCCSIGCGCRSSCQFPVFGYFG